MPLLNDPTLIGAKDEVAINLQTEESWKGNALEVLFAKPMKFLLYRYPSAPSMSQSSPEGDYVYEIPGLASPGDEKEVKNPLYDK
ncbi:unnamed protein product [Hydatigera taeniaeformis]|uniref:Pullulanase n=1 Tax=Hydatigena taeniaeformis TaxID=6205 RepID=A0A0R3X2H7_HYDTA|nr:unnamed protein product [Hydatigera taeniaeformis]